MEDGNNKRRKSDDSTQTKVNDSPTVLAQVEDFIKHFHDGDIFIAPEATTLQIEIPAGAMMGFTSYETRSYADMLGWLIGVYQLWKDDPTQVGRKRECAYHMLDFIERGRVYGIIKNLNLTNKIKECQEQNQRLKDNQQKLEEKILELERNNQELHKALDVFGGRSDAESAEE